MSDSIHEKVGAFADGELPAEEAEAFRVHLVDCAACQEELRDIMMLAATTAPLASTVAKAPVEAAKVAAEVAPTVVPIDAARARRRRAVVAAVTAFAAAAAIVILWRATRPEPIVLAQADKRAIEARLSWGASGVDRWRPYDVQRAAGSAGEEVRVDVLAALEKRGDWRGLADAYLLAGEPARAAEALAKAGESADVESDRAALALAGRDGKAALTHVTKALQLAPGHAQAVWNRALALRELGLTHSAVDAFDRIAARGEAGWGAEAKARAKALRDRDREAETVRKAADAAGREMAKSGLPPPLELIRAYPKLIEFYLGRAVESLKPQQLVRLVAVAEALDPSGEQHLADAVRGAAKLGTKFRRQDWPDPRLASLLALEQATNALRAGHADQAEKGAIGGFAWAQRIGLDPKDVPRRFLVLAAEAARAQGNAALADAYVDEARELL